MKLFDDMKIRHKYAYIIFKVENDMIIPDVFMTTEVSSKLGSEATYEHFVSSMPKDEGRYAIYDFEIDNGVDGMRSVIAFIFWAPDTSKVRSRMLYASSKNDIRRRLDGIRIELQCTDETELSQESIFEKIAPKGTGVPVIRPPRS
ncbi:hypothetical protein HDU76_001223 [Blyttiomyces sp. JEL0837]|nr:hypothetical protein HDU76_001223 [Blyttiomyces sp. JEL0837]